MPRKARTETEGQAAPAVHTPTRAKYVTVASKLPMSLELQLCRKESKAVSGRFGTEQETVFVKYGTVYIIRGVGYPRGNELPEGYPERPSMIRDAGYALTPDVDAAWFAEWLDQNAETEMVRNGLIKAHSEPDSLRDMAMEHKGILTGLEPMNPKFGADGKPLDPRSPKPLNAALQVQKADLTAA